VELERGSKRRPFDERNIKKKMTEMTKATFRMAFN
tara:strand:+ start:597 stop:701 length:105 start_codon:yes stop_codon:yes gene_type:complete